MATATPSKTTGSGTPAARTRFLGRAVVWIGLALGTAATVLAVMHGIRFPGLQVVLSVLVTWLLLIVVAVTAAELLRRHHRAAARHAWRHGKRGARFAGRHGKRAASAAGRRGRAGSGHLAQKAAARWENRQHRPLMFTRPQASGAEPPPPYVTGGPAPAAADDPPAATPGGGTPPSEGKTTMADTTIVNDGAGDPAGKARPKPTRGRSASGPYSAGWKQVVADTSDFEPEDDGHLLNWMAAEVNGMSAYAEAMTEVYETCVNTVGLDPVAMKATHDVADAAADAASAMAAARVKFASHYSEVREFAANGGLIPFDGRWITGDGDA